MWGKNLSSMNTKCAHKMQPTITKQDFVWTIEMSSSDRLWCNMLTHRALRILLFHPRILSLSPTSLGGAGKRGGIVHQVPGGSTNKTIRRLTHTIGGCLMVGFILFTFISMWVSLINAQVTPQSSMKDVKWVVGGIWEMHFDCVRLRKWFSLNENYGKWGANFVGRLNAVF